MADKDFKVKNKLVVKGISSAGPLTIDASGNVDSTSYIPTQYGGTGTSTSPTSGQVLYSAEGTNYAATDLSSLTISNSGGSTITSSSASVKGLIIKGASSQSADLQQWQDSSSSVLASISSSGLLDLSAVNGTWSPVIVSNIGDKIGLWNAGGAASFGFGIQASRTVAFVPSGSGFSVRKAVASGDKSSGTDAVVLFETGAITQTLSSASVKGLVIKGASSQTANLQEWQNSSGTVLAKVNSSGSINAVGLTLSSTVSGDMFVVDPTYGNLTSRGGAIGFNGSASLNIGTSWGGGSAIVASGYTDQSVPTVIIKSVTSQTSNLTEWQNSSGTAVASISNNGVYSNQYGVTIAANILLGSGAGASGYPVIAIQNVTSAPSSNPNNGGNLYVEGGALKFRGSGGTTAQFEAYAATDKPIVIKGASSQSANLQEWQNSSGTALAYISSDGTIHGGGSFLVDGTYGITNIRAATLGGSLNVGTGYALQQGIIVRGAASQSANLQEWQNSSGTVLASISAAGNLTVQDLTVNGTTTTINSTTLTVDDKNIELASVTSPTDTTADGAGITIKGATDKTFNWVQSTGAFTSSEPISTPALSVTGNSVSSDITLVAGKRYFVDTTAARTLTLPASPSVGNEIQIFDASNSAGTYNITIDSNSNKLSGSVQNLIIDTNAAAVFLVYTGSTYGWMVL